MKKGILYYTDNRLGEPILSKVQETIAASGLPIVSVSLKPIKFGNNIVLNLEPGIETMYKQILAGLQASQADVIFFCEHDVLYPLDHFDFEPEKDDIYYYNAHVWRWDYPKDRLITYERLLSQSGLCAKRKLLLKHYIFRQMIIDKYGWTNKYGYEPGLKKIRRGGISDEDFDTWYSSTPMIDIRHNKTLTPRKCKLTSFKHPPDLSTWKEVNLDHITNWKLREIFGL